MQNINSILFGKRNANGVWDVNSKLGAGLFILHI